MKVAQKLKESEVAWQVRFAETPKYSQIRLQQGKEAFRPVLMHLPTRVFLLRVVHPVMLIAHDQPLAAGRVRVELTASLHGEIGRLLHRLDRKVPGRLDHHTPLAT